MIPADDDHETYRPETGGETDSDGFPGNGGVPKMYPAYTVQGCHFTEVDY